MSAYTYFSSAVWPFTVNVPLTADCAPLDCAAATGTRLRSASANAQERTMRRESIVSSFGRHLGGSNKLNESSELVTRNQENHGQTKQRMDGPGVRPHRPRHPRSQRNHR